MKTSVKTVACVLLISACNESSPEVDDPQILDAVELVEDATDASADEDGQAGDVNVKPDIIIGACPDEDRLSPNHSAEAATVVQGSLAEDDLYICPDASDYFSVDVPAGRTLAVQIDFAHRIGDLDLYLFAAGSEITPENAVAESATEEDTEQFTFRATTAGQYIIFVESFEGAEGVYDLNIALSCASSDECEPGFYCSLTDGQCVEELAPLCGSDELEPNDSPEAATLVATTDGYDFRSGLRVCEEDDDYFVVERTEPFLLQTTLSFSGNENLDVLVFDDFGDYVGGANSTDLTTEISALRALPAGRYFVVIDDIVTSLGLDVRYDVEFLVQPSSCETSADCGAEAGRELCLNGGCVPFRPDTLGEGGAPCDDGSDCIEELGCYTGRSGFDDNICTANCESDGDCGFMDGGHCVAIQQTGVCFPGCETDNDCPLLYSCQSGRCDTAGCNVDADCDAGQLCRRSEQRNSGLCTSAEFPQCAQDDEAEDNDTQSTASPLDDEFEAQICDDDDDWFTVQVDEDASTLTVEVEFDTETDIDVYIFDASGRTVGAGTSGDSNPEVAVAQYLRAGTYSVRVNQVPGAEPFQTSYSIGVAIEAGDVCTVAGEECLELNPLRVTCDERTGSCDFIEGNGEIELGGFCDSIDDCSGDAEFCWQFEPATEYRNICTISCEQDADCEGIEGTVCEIFRGRFGACLP